MNPISLWALLVIFILCNLTAAKAVFHVTNAVQESQGKQENPGDLGIWLPHETLLNQYSLQSQSFFSRVKVSTCPQS